MRGNVFRFICVLGLLLCHCTHRTNRISIQSATITLHDKSVDLGDALKNWRIQLGAEDTTSELWAQWRSKGLLAYVKTNPCGKDYVTGIKVNLQKNQVFDGASPVHLALWDTMEFHSQRVLSADTLVLSRSGERIALVYNAADKSYQYEDTAFNVLIEVDESRRPTQLFYALSSEACAKLGLELSIEEQQAFRSLHCGASAPSLNLTNGSIDTPEGKVILGDRFEQWKKQWGSPDSFSFGVASWPKWGLDINYSVNACDEKRVTAFSIHYRVPPKSGLPSTRLPIRLENCAFQYHGTVHGDTLNCGNQKSKMPLLLVASSEPKPSEIFFRSSKESESTQRKKPRVFKSESVDGLIALEVDTLGHIMRLDYSLSNEQAFRIGFERSPQEQKDFADSGKCDSIPSLWER